MTADVLDFALDARKRASDDLDSPTCLVDVVAIVEGHALMVGVGTGLGIDEGLHVGVAHGDDGGFLVPVALGLGHEL